MKGIDREQAEGIQDKGEHSHVGYNPVHVRELEHCLGGRLGGHGQSDHDHSNDRPDKFTRGHAQEIIPPAQCFVRGY